LRDTPKAVTPSGALVVFVSSVVAVLQAVFARIHAHLALESDMQIVGIVETHEFG
jgi:hypothetical protein